MKARIIKMRGNLMMMALIVDLYENKALPVICYTNGVIKQITIKKLNDMVDNEELEIEDYNLENDGCNTKCIIYVNNEYKCDY